MSETDLSPDAQTDAQTESIPYQVLARKYRPTTFAGLIGQDVMVQTLTNAINSDRLAQAFILTGVRGIGKTSTARIIARALNCIGEDGAGGPTPAPCGVCEHCRAIAEDRHVDVLEMDAASHTGIDNIREVIDGVRYRPTTARFKIYIIDEVHMLSKQAFNALLKTLEEPPEHVKFVFATTEIRKVPVTVLSRCQRFDLRRVDAETLAAHFAAIAKKENAEISESAVALIARAADGSVRDGLSLLDQAIAHGAPKRGGAHGAPKRGGAQGAPKQGEIGEAQIRDMLGLADRSQSFTLLEAVLGGEVAQALELLDRLYKDGADPLAVLEDLLEITHWLTRIKVAPGAANSPEVPEIERVRGKDLESRLSMASLARAWQMLLKGLQEVRIAPSPIQATEMVLVRLAHAAELPTPEEALKAMGQSGGEAVSAAPARSLSPASPASPPPPVAPAPPPVPAAGPKPETAALKTEAEKHPLVQAVMNTFPGATVEEVRTTEGETPSPKDQPADG